MNDDQLRNRIQRLDPVPPEVLMEAPATLSAQARREHIMSTTTESTTTLPSPARPRRHRGPIGLAVAAALLVIAGFGVFVAQRDPGGDGTQTAGPPLELSLGDSALASCMVFDVATLSDMSPAFAATATAVEDNVVTLQVDKWYAGGDAAEVRLEALPGMQALIDGFDFVVGDQYLITAAEGTVNFCGYSGPATPELTAAFEQAFAG